MSLRYFDTHRNPDVYPVRNTWWRTSSFDAPFTPPTLCPPQLPRQKGSRARLRRTQSVIFRWETSRKSRRGWRRSTRGRCEGSERCARVGHRCALRRKGVRVRCDHTRWLTRWNGRTSGSCGSGHDLWEVIVEVTVTAQPSPSASHRTLLYPPQLSIEVGCFRGEGGRAGCQGRRSDGEFKRPAPRLNSRLRSIFSLSRSRAHYSRFHNERRRF